MTPSQELRAQREAVMTGTWVQREPVNPNEACLVARHVVGHFDTQSPYDLMSEGACDFVVECLRDMGIYAVGSDDAAGWNDDRASHSQVIEVLDRAIKLAELAEEGEAL